MVLHELGKRGSSMLILVAGALLGAAVTLALRPGVMQADEPVFSNGFPTTDVIYFGAPPASPHTVTSHASHLAPCFPPVPCMSPGVFPLREPYGQNGQAIFGCA